MGWVMILEIEAVPSAIRLPVIPRRFAEWFYAERLFVDGFHAGISRAQVTRSTNVPQELLPPASTFTQLGRDAWIAGNAAGYEAYIEAKELRPRVPPALLPAPAGNTITPAAIVGGA